MCEVNQIGILDCDIYHTSLSITFMNPQWKNILSAHFIPLLLLLLLLLLLSRFSRVWLCVTPWTAAYQASPSMGFSRQEHWTGLPFPSPIHESGKWRWSCSVVSNSWRPHGLQLTRLLHPWDFPGKSTGVGCHCLLHICMSSHIKKYGKRYRWNSFW